MTWSTCFAYGYKPFNLIFNGINGSIIRVLYYMYLNANRVSNMYASYLILLFIISKYRQGEILSLLFAILSMFVSRHYNRDGLDMYASTIRKILSNDDLP